MWRSGYPPTVAEILHACRSGFTVTRFAHVDGIARSSSSAIGSTPKNANPEWRYARSNAEVPIVAADAPIPSLASSPLSRSASKETIAVKLAPSRHSRLIARRVSTSGSTTARSSEPQGRIAVTLSARLSSSGGSFSAEARTKRAFCTRSRLRAALRDASRSPSTAASIPMWSTLGVARAEASANLPSPVPRSMATRPPNSWASSQA
jgi:hypothetical protein